MAPVIQTTPKDRERAERPKKPGERRSELICRVKYSNILPDLPFDPKFITYPFDSNRFVQYKPTSLEKNYKHDLLTEHDLGVAIDLINPDTYAIPIEYMKTGVPLPTEDEKLLEEETTAPTDSKRSRHHNKVVPWLKKTEYISTEFNRYGAASEKTETKVGYNIKKLFKDDSSYMDRDSQIAAINKTFEDAKKPISEHHSKRGVTPVEILPVYPDFSLWKYPFAQVQFDADPAPLSHMEEMSQAMIRGVMDESGEQFVAYFLPIEETLRKRKRDEEQGVEYVFDEEYEYKMAREYNWIVKNKNMKGYEENYFFVYRDDGVYYNELETRVRLSKRRIKGGSYANNSKLFVKHRALNDSEFKTQELRLRLLQAPQDEEEEQPEGVDELKPTEVAAEKQETAAQLKPEAAEKRDEPATKRARSSSSSSGSDSSSASSSSGSESDEDAEAARKKKVKQDEEEIFGSASDSD